MKFLRLQKSGVKSMYFYSHSIFTHLKSVIKTSTQCIQCETFFVHSFTLMRDHMKTNLISHKHSKVSNFQLVSLCLITSTVFVTSLSSFHLNLAFEWISVIFVIIWISSCVTVGYLTQVVRHFQDRAFIRCMQLLILN
jgi:hypothetical protein